MATNFFPFVASALIGYFCGAFPTGYFAGRMWGVDVRKHGSGRTGGTNVLRSAGWGAFLLTFFGDLFKGALAVLLSRAFFPDAIDAHAFTAFFVMLGHIWSVFILLLAKPDPRVVYPPGIRGTIQKFAQRGRGGAGVAPTSGAMITLFPPIALVVVLPFFIWIFARYASVGSISVALASPFLMLYFWANGFAPWSYFLVTLLVCVVVIIVHRPNIERLRAGTEKKLGERLGQRARKPDSTPSSR